MIELAKSLREVEGVDGVRVKVNVFTEDYVEVLITLSGQIDLDKISEVLDNYKVVINYVDEVEM